MREKRVWEAAGVGVRAREVCMRSGMGLCKEHKRCVFGFMTAMINRGKFWV